MSSDFQKSSEFLRKLKGERDLKRILETTVKELGDTFACECCQVMLSNPLDPNVTSIYEHKPMKDAELHGLPVLSLPLVLHGRTFGALNMSRRFEVTAEEITTLRVIMGELGDIVRHAQINEVVTRDTFRETFLVEIGNVMAYSLGIGDALFMVVNILGKVLQASRCLFICTDDTQLGWKCYEFWQQEKVQSCQEYRWPTTDSPVVAQTLLASAPLKIYEGQQNSYVSPVQEELQFMGVKSLLGVALKSSEAVHGAVILQQCDYRRAWTRNEIDMVQNVADKVAEALLKLPAEKRAREPIMQLHQRVVTLPDQDDGRDKIQNVRRALKGALGQQAIPTASKTGAPPPPPQAPAVRPPKPTPAAAAPKTPVLAPPPAAKTSAPAAPTQTGESFAPQGQPTISPVQPKGAGQVQTPAAKANQAPAQATPQQASAPVKSLGNILGAANAKALSPQGAPQAEAGAQSVAAKVLSSPEDPYADLDFGDFGELEPSRADRSGQKAGARKQMGDPNNPDTTWANLDAIESPSGQALTEPAEAAPAQEPAALKPAEVVPTEPAGSVEPAAAATVEPATAAAAAVEAAPSTSPWGDLDAIQAPSTAPARAGLGGMMLGKARASSPGRNPLSAAFHKGRAATAAAEPGEPGEPAAHAGSTEAQPVAIDEESAKARLQELVASSASETSDYIFATKGLDMRMLGRIDGWVSQIEKKDKYVGGHARQVAEYAQAIAKEAGMSEDEVNMVRLAALVHDVGKLGAAAQILQKPDDLLSDPELITVMKHPLDGAELLESFPDLKHLAPIVRAHHEEFDGNGYPQGLKGEEIPVAARIIHVANSYHGLTTTMCYGPGKPPQEAQNELVKGAGKQWDPTYVQALLQAIMTQKVPPVF